VYGYATINGITLPLADGSNGQALVTNGAGQLSFATLGGGGGGFILTFVGDDSSGTILNSDRTFSFIGTQNIGTAVSGDTLTITGPDLTNYAQKTETAINLVGDDSTGTAVTFGETFKIAGGTNITTAVSGDIVTVTGSSNITVNEISSADSSAIQINDSVNISGSLGADVLDVNEISSGDSSAIQINDSVNISGTLTVPTINVSTISAPSSLVGTYTISSPTTITLSPTSEVLNTAPFTLYSRTVAQLSTLVATAGAMVYCTNETGGAVPVFYDGANWRRVTDRAIAS